MSRYGSQAPALVNDDYYHERSRNTRYRSPSPESEYGERKYYNQKPPRERRQSSSKYDKIAKVAIVVVVLQLVVTALHFWHKDHNAEQEQEYRRQKRKEFERAKATRRRDEERWEKEQEWHHTRDPVPEVRRITYPYPASDPSSSPRSRNVGRVTRTPSSSGRSSSRSSVGDRGYNVDRRRASRMR